MTRGRTSIRGAGAVGAITIAFLWLGLGLIPAGAQLPGSSVEQATGAAADPSEEQPTQAVSTPAWGRADNSASPSFIPEATTFSASGMLMRVGLGLVLVLGILGGVLFLYKKGARGSLGSNSRNGIELLTQRSLGQRSSLAVVRVGGETMLLGITATQINMLAPLGPRPAAEDVPQAAEDPFESVLAGEVRRVRENLVTSLRRLDLERK